jgi:hypothetical protein
MEIGEKNKTKLDREQKRAAAERPPSLTLVFSRLCIEFFYLQDFAG